MDIFASQQFALGGGARRAASVQIGLLNNMPDAAMRATELQFAKLLKQAASALGPRAMDVRLHLFSLSGMGRAEPALSRMEGFYCDAGGIPAAGLDALIITAGAGNGDDMRRAAYWPGLAGVIDWAELGTLSTFFSGAAAEAAVRHLDKVSARPLPRKIAGVYAVRRVEQDHLLAGTTAVAEMPHARDHELALGDLAAKGYRILTRLEDGGADLFVRKARSLFIFTQGHPEYDGATLGRHYLADVARALQGEAEFPSVPDNLFDRLTEDRLRQLGGEGATDLAAYRRLVTEAVPFVSWRGQTVKIFANWLVEILAEKARRARFLPGRKRA